MLVRLSASTTALPSTCMRRRLFSTKVFNTAAAFFGDDASVPRVQQFLRPAFKSSYPLPLSLTPALGVSRRNRVRSNIVIMGPPGAGKTSVGRLLAARLDMACLDVDNDHLEKVWGMPVAQKLKELGDDEFLQEEALTTMQIEVTNTVISLSGSNPLHRHALMHLAKDSVLLYLDVDKTSILERMNLMKTDRIVGMGTQTLAAILDKRLSVYENSYDLRVTVAEGDSLEKIADKALVQLRRQHHFISTRGYAGEKGGGVPVTFQDAVNTGLAPDGGLYVPAEFVPFDSLAELFRLLPLSYQERTLRVLERFPTGHIPPSSLRRAVFGAMLSFSKSKSRRILPLVPLEGKQFLLECHHGPTASFKDLSLQLSPFLLSECQQRGEDRRPALLVATSGDTGTAALEAFGRSSPDTPVVVLYPAAGVSEVQRLQMETAPPHACVLAVEGGDFDFCQRLVKDVLSDSTLLADAFPDLRFSSVNSINWGRLVPQVAFYVSAYLDLVEVRAVRPGEAVDVVIPTGNFGHALAAFYAKGLGVPIARVVAACNSNNVVAEFLASGNYDVTDAGAAGGLLQKTASPSMDIKHASNLERLLFLMSGNDAAATKGWFESLAKDGRFSVPAPLLKSIQQHITGGWCSEAATFETVRQVFSRTGFLLDPHTAVAKHVADQKTLSSFQAAKDAYARPAPRQDRENAMGVAEPPALGRVAIIAATAHYSKFPDTVLKAVGADFPNPYLKKGRVTDAGGYVAAALDQLASLGPLSGIHYAVEELPDKEASQRKTVPADRAAILGEIRAYLSSFGAAAKR
jgi:threonine synthase